MKGKLITAGVAAAALAAGGAGAALAVGSDEDDAALSGPQADHAIAAALKAVRGGTSAAVERDVDGAAVYEVEVLRSDGTTVEVRLNSAYKLVGTDDDSEAAGADD